MPCHGHARQQTPSIDSGLTSALQARNVCSAARAGVPGRGSRDACTAWGAGIHAGADRGRLPRPRLHRHRGAGDEGRSRLSDAQMGYVFSAFTLAYALFEVPSGWLADRFGARLMLTRIVVWWSAMTAATGLVGGFASLVAVRFLFGVGEAGAFPSMARAYARWLPAPRARTGLRAGVDDGGARRRGDAAVGRSAARSRALAAYVPDLRHGRCRVGGGVVLVVSRRSASITGA